MHDHAVAQPARARRWRASSLVVVTLVIVALTAVGGSASATTTTTLRPGDKYVALGSSFASGPLIPNEINHSCLRSDKNYAHLVAAKLKLALTDVSCGNATTDNVVSTPQGANPLQIQAVTPDTKLVTVTIGGNDVDYTVSNLVCAHDGAAGTSCLGTSVKPEDNAAKMAALPAKMAGMLQAIKAAAPKARVVVLPYLRVMPASATPCPPAVPVVAAALKYLVDYGDQLHAVIKKSAAAARVDFVDSYPPKGHDACAAPAQRWVEERWVDETHPRPALPYHPTALGMKVQAKMILDKLKSKS